MPHHTEAEVLARLDELRARRDQLLDDERAILEEIKEWLRIGSELRVDGEPLNRSVLIERAGISRRTAYRILDVLPEQN